MSGFILTWDVDSADRGQCSRVRFFVFGKTVVRGDRIYRYQGFVDRTGVRYLGQSVLFVTAQRLSEIRPVLLREGISHVVSEATLGPIVR